MSVVDPPREDAQAPQGECPRCGSELRPGQDWCLNCGNAVTTTVAGTPGWRAPVAIVGAVLALAVIGLVIAFLEISDDAEQVANAPAPATSAQATAPPGQSPAPTAAPTLTPTPGPGTSPTPGPSPDPNASPSPSPTASPGSGTVAGWPAGEEAWTVILLSTERKADADRRARDLATQGMQVGVLNSDDYQSLRAGYWVVFSGQYETQEEAQEAAEGLGADRAAAYARFVKE